MTLSDDEKRQARATDPRARAIIDAADEMPPEIMDRLHGAIRYLRDGPAGRPTATSPTVEATNGHLVEPPVVQRDDPDWPTFTTPGDDAMPSSVWEPEARVAPHLLTIEVGGFVIGKGSSVRLRPNRRADAMDMFLVGRRATVEAIFESVDDDTFVAVTIDDDPATELHREFGRFFYFAPDELEPLSESIATGRDRQQVLAASEARG